MGSRKGVRMVEQALTTLEQYDLEIKSARKGRDSWLITSSTGEFVLKEYRGSEKRIQTQKWLTDEIMSKSGVLVQQIVPNKEGNLLSKDAEETTYVLQTFMEGRECDVKEPKDCKAAIITMAKMHQVMQMPKQEELQGYNPYSLQQEFTKRNTELRRIRRYLKEKRQKNDFERFLYKSIPYFLEMGLKTEEEWAYYEKQFHKDPQEYLFCHGDYQHHNVWFYYDEIMILQFEKFMTDMPCRDLYLFLRKLLEKNNWDASLGKEMLQVYNSERKLPYQEQISMIYRFAYPEKFWKIANYYFNGKKSFVPGKNLEKLERLLEQEEMKKTFINHVLREVN